jgi:hypothetical protein
LCELSNLEATYAGDQNALYDLLEKIGGYLQYLVQYSPYSDEAATLEQQVADLMSKISDYPLVDPRHLTDEQLTSFINDATSALEGIDPLGQEDVRAKAQEIQRLVHNFIRTDNPTDMQDLLHQILIGLEYLQQFTAHDLQTQISDTRTTIAAEEAGLVSPEEKLSYTNEIMNRMGDIYNGNP